MNFLILQECQNHYLKKIILKMSLMKISILNKIDSEIKIKIINHLQKVININFDYEQFNRLFLI